MLEYIICSLRILAGIGFLFTVTPTMLSVLNIPYKEDSNKIFVKTCITVFIISSIILLCTLSSCDSDDSKVYESRDIVVPVCSRDNRSCKNVTVTMNLRCNKGDNECSLRSIDKKKKKEEIVVQRRSSSTTDSGHSVMWFSNPIHPLNSLL